MTSAIFLPLSPASNFPFLTFTPRARPFRFFPTFSTRFTRISTNRARIDRSAQLLLWSSSISHPRNIQRMLATKINKIPHTIKIPLALMSIARMVRWIAKSVHVKYPYILTRWSCFFFFWIVISLCKLQSQFCKIYVNFIKFKNDLKNSLKV